MSYLQKEKSAASTHRDARLESYDMNQHLSLRSFAMVLNLPGRFPSESSNYRNTKIAERSRRRGKRVTEDSREDP